MGAYLTLLGAVAPVFVIVAAGWLLRRLAWLTAEADHSLLRLNINLLYPCLIADTILGNPVLDRTSNLVIPPLVGLGTVIAGFAIAALAARMLRLAWPQPARTFAFTTGLYNYGFLPIPLVLALFDRETMGVLFTHNLGVEIALWSAGVWLLSGGSAEGFWKKVLNVPIVAILACVALNFVNADIWLPQFIRSAMHSMGQMSIPMSLLLTGATFADLVRTDPVEPADAAAHRGGAVISTAMAVLLRLAILPLGMLALARWLPCSIELRRIIAIESAMPSAMIPIILARLYRADEATALRIVLVTTVLGLLTIPMWLRFGFWWAGVK